MNSDAFFDDGPPLAQLQAAVAALDEYVAEVAAPRGNQEATVTKRRDAEADAKGSTPVQVFAKQPFVATQWRELRRAHVAIYGLNAIGARAAESLVRMGIGKLLLVDHTLISLGDLGEMAYTSDDVGFSRTQALRLRLQSICTAERGGSTHTTRVESFSADATHAADRAELRKKLKVSSVGNVKRPSVATPEKLDLFEALTQKQPYDAVLCCTSDVDAKMHINAICLELSLPLLDVSLSPCNSRISIHTLLPGHTCCLECVLATKDPTPEDQVAQSLASAFPAVLPHVELTAAGLLAQHTIKFLLGVGEFVPFFRMDLLTLETESYAFPPNAGCSSVTCLQRQDEACKHVVK
ncbi:hypothetical protein BBJ28_00007454 [Nothophytophthora sp. Chile5]|nr:hypothetical protein BBJ28_00007454 [Nothophytophthora sp. Chile5]